MKDQNDEMFRWIIVGSLGCFFLVIPEVLIAKLISKNNYEAFASYSLTMLLITMFIYLIISAIKLVKYIKDIKKDEREKVEKATKELTSEFKEVWLNYSEPISKDLFKCTAKVDDDGKIICKIELDYEVKIESYEKFLRHFHFDQD